MDDLIRTEPIARIRCELNRLDGEPGLDPDLRAPHRAIVLGPRFLGGFGCAPEKRASEDDGGSQPAEIPGASNVHRRSGLQFLRRARMSKWWLVRSNRSYDLAHPD
jgi:hypothetical protein